ncbi:hypothetical protein F5876DRAFT_73816 [Lentinula aff. lateritia]|uniref:Uncharacterized protein n=1 Tax=Lentinula aff. lateritia TaxID=2804960 RepID=A0ACC1U9T6_9AGAR|nr:hypothetical protein F5876DRAFT_73816 [Lentinula aff. lateritia]
MSPTTTSSSSSNAASTVTSTISPISPTNSGSSSPDITTEVIVGGLIAGVLVALIVAGLVYFLCQRNQGRKSSKGGGGGTLKDRRGRSMDGSDPLLNPTISQLGQGNYNPYVETVSIPARPMHPEISLNYTEIDMLEPLPSSSSVIQEVPMSLSPPRPSLPPLVIPPLSIAPSATRYPAKIPSVEHTVVPTVEHNSNNPSSAVSVDDAASESSMSAYSQASASTRIHKAWEDNTQIPPIPEIPSYLYNAYIAPEVADENTSLARGNTTKVAALLKSRARRAQRGKSLSRSSTKISRIERSDSLESIPFTPRTKHTESQRLHRDASTLGTKSPAPSEAASLTIRNPFADTSSSSRSTSVTTSIANHTVHTVDPPYYAHRLSVIDNEEAETESLYADEVPTFHAIMDTPPLRISKYQVSNARS